jgi:hypothetical protein
VNTHENSIFPLLILNARPAAGKSEITQYLENVPIEERIRRFHVGPIKVLDDFPMLWAWFEEDDLLENQFHSPRLHSTSDHYFKDPLFWNVLIRRLSLNFEKWMRDSEGSHTTIIEFSRGSEHGGYTTAYQHFSDQILEICATLYINVSFEESRRKNALRRNPQRPDSILEHSLEDEKIERLYGEDDWGDLTLSNRHYFHIRNHQIPFTIFENEDDLTTSGGDALGSRLETSLKKLWGIRSHQNKS